MFGMGWQEILLILVIAVLVIGPDQLPQVARTVGKLIAQFRRLTNDLRDSLNKEFSGNENLKDFKEFHQSIDAEFRSVSTAAQSYVEKEVAKEEQELRKLEQEVKTVADEATQAATQDEATPAATQGDAPGEPTADWPASADAFPAQGGDAAPTDEPAAADANGSREPAAVSGSNGSGKDSAPDSQAGGTHKESA